MNKLMQKIIDSLLLDRDVIADVQSYHLDMIILKANARADALIERDAKEVDLYERYEKSFLTRKPRK